MSDASRYSIIAPSSVVVGVTVTSSTVFATDASYSYVPDAKVTRSDPPPVTVSPLSVASVDAAVPLMAIIITLEEVFHEIPAVLEKRRESPISQSVAPVCACEPVVL